MATSTTAPSVAWQRARTWAERQPRGRLANVGTVCSVATCYSKLVTTGLASAGIATLSGLNGLVRLYLLDPSEFEPYAAIGLGLAFADESPGGSPLTGPAFSAGIGGDLKLNDVLTLGAKLMYRGAFFDNRQSHLAGAPQDTAFLSMVSLSGHIRLNF